MLISKYMYEGQLISKRENKEYISTKKGLERAMQEGKILEGVVKMCDNTTLSMHLELGEIDGIIKKEESVYGVPVKDIGIITRVGKAVAFKVVGFERDEVGRTRAVLSRRLAQKECMENYILSLRPGDIIPAKITHQEPFGAFVDVGCGISSLLSVDSVSVSRIASPADRFYPRQEICVVVKSIDYESGRMYVSTKELFGTWEENAKDFHVGQTVSGIIRSVESYGVFVELAPNLAGLAEIYDGAEAGERCSVYIKSIMPEKMKIKLVIIDTCESDLPSKNTLDYFVDTRGLEHMDYWKYSPESCPRVIETVFDV